MKTKTQTRTKTVKAGRVKLVVPARIGLKTINALVRALKAGRGYATGYSVNKERGGSSFYKKDEIRRIAGLNPDTMIYAPKEAWVDRRGYTRAAVARWYCPAWRSLREVETSEPGHPKLQLPVVEVYPSMRGRQPGFSRPADLEVRYRRLLDVGRHGLPRVGDDLIVRNSALTHLRRGESELNRHRGPSDRVTQF